MISLKYWEQWLAVISALIALLSALYARYAYTQAKKANQLTIHNLIKPIYVAFDNLTNHMDLHGKYANKSEVQKFCPYKMEVPLYLNKTIARDIDDYWRACFDMSDLSARTSSGRLSPEEAQSVEECEAIEKRLRSSIKRKFESIMKSPL
ncbi:hypothetical protein G3495_02165 [Shewanella baltica]|uniref:hypothetical protein n=1 Tax=Shewanella baltica TaxID=62322 RepID=UPI00217CC215|nr:hypothetical protein [Shewanella baltica]MCS6233943.1 hypothetical protein [Shewanella baltica]MCS6257751.1 hypothetical protein [Shewanella baltica]MCS6268527.1 hypothetical protein [Shewanella baltica]